MALATFPNIKPEAFLMMMSSVIGGRRVGLPVGVVTVLGSDILMSGVRIWTLSNATWSCRRIPLVETRSDSYHAQVGGYWYLLTL